MMTLLSATMLGLTSSAFSAETIPDDDPSIMSLGVDGARLERNMVKSEKFEGPSNIMYVVGENRARKHGVDLAVFEEKTRPSDIDELLLYLDVDIDIVLIGQ